LLFVSQIAESSTAFAAKNAKSSQSTTEPSEVPHDDIISCLTIALTLNNDSPAHLQVTIGVDNTCPADVTPPINWDITSELSCGDQTTSGPSDQGNWVNTLVKDHMYTIANEGFNITCIINSAPGYWTTDVDVTVDGSIQYGDNGIASGTATRSLGGV
jgi:hypothetical protein